MRNSDICLVPASAALAPAVTDYYRRNREFLRPFDPVREDAFFTLERQREILRAEEAARASRTGFRFYIAPADSPETVIGSIGLNNIVWGAFRSAFLGYKLDAAYLNRGYMTAAVGMVVRYAFAEAGLHRVEANVMPRNRPSLRVLEKNGFINEGLSRCYLNINGVWEDHIHMVRINFAMHGSAVSL